MTETLYKYRSLTNFKNFIDILLKNRLYAARYQDLNDPMEGQYYYNKGQLNNVIRDKIKTEKGELRICSLSRVNNNELMWSHYSDGQRGIVIGLKIDKNKYQVRPINYEGSLFISDEDYHEKTAIEILSHKSYVWNYEEEERVFQRNLHYIDIEICQLITGRRMSHQDFSLVNELARKINPNIDITKAEDLL